MERFITHIDYEVLLTRIDGLMRKEENNSEKNSYITMLLHSSTNDERRLLFYYVVSRNDVEKEELVSLFCRFRFFDSLRIPSLPLIYPEDWDELNA